MALKEQIQTDTKAALLSGNRFEADVLRNLKAAILNEEVAQNKREDGLTDTDIEKIIAKEVKKRAESTKLYEENGRPDLAEVEKNESRVLETYLPKQLSEDAVKTIIDEIVAGMGDVTMAQMGQVIGAVKAKAGNTADGAIVARLVKERLGK